MPAELASPTEETEPLVWPDMQAAVSIFLAMRTQWRWVGAGMGGLFRTGLDYSALPMIAAVAQEEITPRVLSDIGVMEDEALSVWARR